MSLTGKERKNSGFIANNDIAFFATEMGFRTLDYIREENPSYSNDEIRNNIKKILQPVQDEDNVFVQFPTWQRLNVETALFEELFNKNITVSLLVWDVLPWLHDDSDRDYTNEYAFRLMNKSDLIIAPNPKMAYRLRDEGGVKTKIISMDLWDFRTHSQLKTKNNNFKQVFFAGTLDKTDFSNYKGKTKIHLLGNPNGLTEEERSQSNLVVLGEFDNKDLPKQLTNGFGLISYVGGGNSHKKRFKGSEKYGHFNTPLKLSFYLANGIPVIMDSGSAHVTLIREQNLGLVIDNLNDLDQVLGQMTQDDYNYLKEQVKMYSQRITTGYYTKRILSQALSLL